MKSLVRSIVWKLRKDDDVETRTRFTVTLIAIGGTVLSCQKALVLWGPFGKQSRARLSNY